MYPDDVLTNNPLSLMSLPVVPLNVATRLLTELEGPLTKSSTAGISSNVANVLLSRPQSVVSGSNTLAFPLSGV